MINLADITPPPMVEQTEMIEENNDEYYFNNSSLVETEHYEVICEMKQVDKYIQSTPALFINYEEAYKIFNEWTTKYEYDRIRLELVKKDGERVYVETYED